MARPRQALLTRERIVDAASRLVDKEGLDALSMRRLATELGVRAVALQPLRHQGRDRRRRSPTR
jgi:AcrR family transcriptional regulator